MTWLGRLWHRRRLERELKAELADHVDRLTGDYLRRGLSAEDARRRALLDFGGVEHATVACREARGTKALIDLVQDVRTAVRRLTKAGRFTAVALVVLTLSIGASTAIFSVVDAVVLRSLPFDEGDRLVSVNEVVRSGQAAPATAQNFLDWRAQQDVFSELAAARYASVVLKRHDTAPPETVTSRYVTSGFFPALRVSPFKGRLIIKDDEINGHDHVVMMSYGFWQERFGGAANIIGRTVPTEDGDLAVVGVLPPTFAYPLGPAKAADLWIPFVPTADERTRGGSHNWELEVLGRLKDGVSIDQAQAEFDRVAAGIVAANPTWSAENPGVRLQSLETALTGTVRTWMLLLLGAVGAVLVLACANVANLMLVRATTQTRELGIRAALGATHWDLARVLLTESLVLSCAGTVLGVALAWWGVDALRSAMPDDVPRAAAIAVNGRVLLAAVAAALLTGLVCGLAPALQFSRPAPGDALKDHGHSHTTRGTTERLRAVLVIFEVAVAAVLMVGSALFIASFARVTRVDLGVRVEHVFAMGIQAPTDAFSSSNTSLGTSGEAFRQHLAREQARNGALILDVVEKVQHVHGIDAVAAVDTGAPLATGTVTTEIQVPEMQLPRRDAIIERRYVSPDYFRVLGTPLLAGRPFTDADRAGSMSVVLLNETAARTYFGGSAAAVGRTVEIADQGALAPFTVVGVVGNIRQQGPESGTRQNYFRPIAQAGALGATLVMHTTEEDSSVVPAVKAAIWSDMPEAVVAVPQNLAGILGARLARRRFNMLLLSLFGVLGLVIAALGLYGVLAYVVTQRTREIGIRMALGAEPATIMRGVIGRAASYLALGLALGLGAAWQFSTFATDFLFEVQPHEIGLYARAAAVLVVAALAAALIPARRATKVDPLIALRTE